jgi:hypothetical protein
MICEDKGQYFVCHVDVLYVMVSAPVRVSGWFVSFTLWRTARFVILTAVLVYV